MSIPNLCATSSTDYTEKKGGYAVNLPFPLELRLSSLNSCHDERSSATLALIDEFRLKAFTNFAKCRVLEKIFFHKNVSDKATGVFRHLQGVTLLLFDFRSP
jgi:hypothetical protein